MTPAEVNVLRLEEYAAFERVMRDELEAIAEANRKARRGR